MTVTNSNQTFFAGLQITVITVHKELWNYASHVLNTNIFQMMLIMR